MMRARAEIKRQVLKRSRDVLPHSTVGPTPERRLCESPAPLPGPDAEVRGLEGVPLV